MAAPRPMQRLPTAVRLAAVQWGIVTLSAILVFGMITRAAEDLPESEARDLVATELRGFADVHALGGLPALATAIARRLDERRSVAHVYLLLAPDGRTIAGNLARWPAGLDLAAMPVTRGARLGVERTDREGKVLVEARAVRLPDGTRLVVGRDAAIEARAHESLGLALLLAIARARSGAGRAQMAAIDLAEIAEDVAELYEPLAADRDATLDLDAAGPVMARGHRDLLFLARSNLVENALRAVGPGGRVTAEGGEARLALADDGPGLPRPVRRTLAALAEGTPGAEVPRRAAAGDGAAQAPASGLGLQLVLAVAAMHDGRLDLVDRAPGLEARLTLPAGGAEAA